MPDVYAKNARAGPKLKPSGYGVFRFGAPELRDTAEPSLRPRLTDLFR